MGIFSKDEPWTGSDSVDYKIIKELREKLEEARKVLEWYGDENNYKRQIMGGGLVIHDGGMHSNEVYAGNPALEDGGTKARELLERWK